MTKNDPYGVDAIRAETARLRRMQAEREWGADAANSGTTLPCTTTCSNSYALILDSPTGPVAIFLDSVQAGRLWDAGVNYEEYDDVDGAALEALQDLL